MSKRYIILLHISFWILFALVPELPMIFPDKKYPLYYYYYTLSSQLLNVLNFYLVYFLISIDFLNTRKIVTNLLKVIGAISFFICLRLFMMVIVYVYMAGMDYQEVTIRFYNIILETYYSISFTMMALLIKFMIDWFNTQKQKSELLARSKTSELALLRTQINPHFLFNTLNNLYSLVYKKSDEAPSMLMKLSDIMRYMLYDSNSDKVLLEKEIEYLESFIELNALRMKEGRFVAFDIEGDIHSRMIPPMLLVPFVENAFKHGRKNYKLPGIAIQLVVTGTRLDFDIRNYIPTGAPLNKDQQGGIGLDNVKKRLDMIYPGTYSLEIKDNGEEYHVHLTIQRL
ncbi:MAG: histidine kinase [Bacteroidales bacterium]|nr:histidine kinase [Bacteroidales bacterium]